MNICQLKEDFGKNGLYQEIPVNLADVVSTFTEEYLVNMVYVKRS